MADGVRPNGLNWAHRRLGACLAVAASFGAMSTAGAIVPQSPSLERESRERLDRELDGAGIGEVARSAVMVTLFGALGAEPSDGEYRYREAYPQLPDVDAVARPVRPNCTAVALTVMPKAERARAVNVNGLYCITDREKYVWQIHSLKVTAD